MLKNCKISAGIGKNAVDFGTEIGVFCWLRL